jgi:hypothetical protein
MPFSFGWYSTNGIGAVSLRNGVPDSRTPRRAPVRLAQRIAPAERVAAVVHLVEDHERARSSVRNRCTDALTATCA